MSWDKDRIVELLLEAGEIAMGLKRNLKRELKADSSIVTQADRQIEDLITAALEDEDAGRYIIGEETVDQKGEDYLQNALTRECFVIDPIDGTSPYAHGMPNWGVSIGYMSGGQLTDGAVYLPEFGEMVISDGEAVLEARLENDEWTWRELLSSNEPSESHQLLGITQRVAKRGRCDVKNPVMVLGAAVVPMVGLLQRRFVGYLGSVKLWDVAGALPLVLRHGFAVSVQVDGVIRRVGSTVDAEAYFLDAGNPRRWKFRSDLLLCRPDDEAWLRKAFDEGTK